MCVNGWSTWYWHVIVNNKTTVGEIEMTKKNPWACYSLLECPLQILPQRTQESFHKSSRNPSRINPTTHRIMVISPTVIISNHSNSCIAKSSFISKNNLWDSSHIDNVSSPQLKHFAFCFWWKAWSFYNNVSAHTMVSQIEFLGNLN